MRALKTIGLVIGSVVLVLVVAWFALSIAARPPASDRFSLVFLGTTNLSGTSRVLLGFTNQSKDTAVWMTVAMWETAKGRRPYDVTNYFLTGFPPKPPPLLKPGGSAVYSIPAPPHSRWRAVARGFRADWRTHLRNWRIGYLPYWLDERLPDSVKTGWSVEVWSDWVEP